MKFLKIKIGNVELKVKDCRGIGSLWGLMFDDMKKHDGALIFGNSVWIPFIKRKLKLLFIDKNFKIIDVQNSIPLSRSHKSWRIYFNYRAKYCLELKNSIPIKRNVKICIKN